MGIKLLESFDDSIHGDRFTGSYGTPHADYGLHGKGIRLGDTPGQYIYIPVDAAVDTAIMGFAFKPVTSGTGDRSLLTFGSTLDTIFYDSTNQRLHAEIQNSAAGHHDQYTPINSVPLGKWSYLEFKWYHNTSSAGTLQMGVNGTYTTEDTGIDYFTTFDFVRLGWLNVTDVSDFYVDDLYIADTNGGVNDDFLGPIVVTPLLPNGNGNSSDLVGQDADSTNNYLNVDEDPPDDGTTYNESGTQGDKDTYAMEDITGTPTVVGAVATMYAKRTETGAKYFRSVARVGGTDYTGSDLALAEDFTPAEEAWDENPDTSTAWTYTTLNGAEFGAEVRD